MKSAVERRWPGNELFPLKSTFYKVAWYFVTEQLYRRKCEYKWKLIQDFLTSAKLHNVIVFFSAKLFFFTKNLHQFVISNRISAGISSILSQGNYLITALLSTAIFPGKSYLIKFNYSQINRPKRLAGFFSLFYCITSPCFFCVLFSSDLCS